MFVAPPLATCAQRLIAQMRSRSSVRAKKPAWRTRRTRLILHPWTLRSGALLLVEFSEGLTLIGQLLQQWRGRPELAVLQAKLADAVVDFFQADRVRIPHRSTAIGWESVAIQIDD